MQSYAWGKIGTTSEVACLSSSGNPGFILKNEAPYAEVRIVVLYLNLLRQELAIIGRKPEPILPAGS